MIKWLIEEKGCTWEKVCAGEGDLILWDSRTVHYGAVPLESTARMATCKFTLSLHVVVRGLGLTIYLCWVPFMPYRCLLQACIPHDS